MLSVQHEMLRMVGALVDQIHRRIQVNTPDLAQGVVTGVNQDGTVQVSVNGDPVPVTATRSASYKPTGGQDLVRVIRHQGWVEVVHRIAGPGD